MTQEQILEGNKLIAEFMGYQGQHEHWCGNNVLAYDDYVECTELQPYSPHESWYWLMPVVEKIEKIAGDHQEVRVVIEGDSSYIRLSHTSLDSGLEEALFSKGVFFDTKIGAVYRNVLDFIKWFNEQKKLS